jgi:predicted SAM-dependent methyltransferase
VRYRLSQGKLDRVVQHAGGYPAKLHLGCGGYCIKGWVNCDVEHRGSEVLRIDLMKELPFPDNSAKFAFMEHVLEHFSIPQLRMVLNNVFRVMQHGGVLRIAQPDLQKMIHDSLLSDNWAKQKDLYSATKGKDLPTGTHYLNLIWTAWGHKFNHTYESLKHELELAGFTRVVRRSYRDSDYPELRSLDMRTQEEDSLIVEATK